MFALSNGNQVLFPIEFLPGEGKLFRLAPVMKIGGTLIADETLNSANFVCDSTVYNDGHNILFYVGCSVKFNQKGKIVMNGGSFESGHYPDNPTNQQVLFQGNNGYQWEGLSFENCTYVEISNSKFSDIYFQTNPFLPGQNTAIDIQDCYDFIVNDCNFILNTQSSAVNINISSNAGSNWANADIFYNNFTFTEHSQCPINVVSLSGNVIPVNISNNHLINDNSQSISMAIFVSGLTGGTIRNNIIKNFNPAIAVASSTLDLFNNYIYSNVESGVGISALAVSDLNTTQMQDILQGAVII